MSDNNELVLYRVEDGIGYLTMNRPKVGNCVSGALMTELNVQLRRADADPEVKIVILTGAGKNFCTGGDLPFLASLDEPAAQKESLQLSGRLTKCIQGMDKPVIAAVNGFACGAGFAFAMACDMIVAADDSKYMSAFSNVGLASDGGGAYLLTKTVGKHKAKELLMLSDVLGAQELADLGIVNKVVPAESLLDEATALAKRLCTRPQLAISLIKQMVNRSDTMSLEDTVVFEDMCQALLSNSSDFKEGTTAFVEKRKPVFGAK